MKKQDSHPIYANGMAILLLKVSFYLNNMGANSDR